jgi:amino acid permease
VAVADGTFLSREEVLGGLPAKRANTLLFAIENRTGQLVARSRSALTVYESERGVEERERAFLDALSAGRAPPVRPRAMDLERYAPDWARLVPPDADLRAYLARLIGTRYPLRRDLVPRLRDAIGLDEPEVQAAYLRLHRAPVETLLVTSIGPVERLAWARARAAERLETLPTFWTAFALTLTETVGAGILALPIALATFGAAAAVTLIVVLGVVNLVTIVALVEGITRSGGMRYGAGYFGRLVGDFLGRPGRLTMNAILAVYSVLVLMIMLLGFGSVVGAATGIPPGVAAAVLLAISLFIIRRGTLDATVASALIFGAIDIGLIGLIALAALARISGENLASAVVRAGGSPDWAAVGFAVAVVLSSYFGHTSAANAAKIVLRRDPSGRSLLAGNAVAMVAAIGIYAVVTVAIIGAVGPTVLTGYRGTSLEVLSEHLGPVVGLLGVIYAALAMGLAAMYAVLGLGNLAVEQLVRPRASELRAGRLSRFLASATGRSVARVVPSILVLAALEWLLFAGTGSFTGLLGLVGALVVPLLGGVFPMLIVVASRRRGELLPGRVVGWVGSPPVAIAVGLVYLGIVAAHGLFIFSSPLERAAAFAVVAAIVAVAALAIRNGAMRPRAVVEVSVDEAVTGRGSFSVLADGRSAPVVVTVQGRRGPARSFEAAAGDIGQIGELRSVTFALPRLGPELKVWLHHVTADRDSVPLLVSASLNGEEPLALDREGQASIPLADEQTLLEIRA